MNLIRLQNWLLTEYGIEYVGPSGNGYKISKNRLFIVGKGDRQNTVDFLVSIAEKTWISIEDLENLNTIFFMAIEFYGIELPANISMEKTIQLQLFEYKSR